ncbi:tRNA lysidine(34) synthetase TilS [Daejeonella sp.]|uniref:tRNA lysidine(34) synthetase TilS n=1 Tax=Daejeonella sp. TaxID=2805397 RepID=UPI003982EACD
MDTLSRLSTFIKQHALFQSGERVLLAVSGGRDSVFMAQLFNEAGFDFGIAHCNFTLRGDESEIEEQFCSDLASELDVPFFNTRFNTLEHSQQNHISIQMAARHLRYQWLEEIRSDFDYQYIAIAQHQNDVMETMLLNLTRGTGIAGMHGILPKKGRIIRPLLFLKRDEIDKIVAERGYLYREDSSNESTKYARNKIRLEVIPVLKKLNPSLEETFEANRKRFQELETLLKNRVRELRSELFKQVGPDEYEIDLRGMKNLDPVDTLLYGLFHSFGFTETVLRDFKRAWNGEPGKMFSSASHDLCLDRDRVILIKRKSIPEDPVYIKDPQASVKWNENTYKSDTIPTGDLKLSGEKSVAQLDLDLLIFPLILRRWNDGDRFQPLGVKGTKKLSDFFTEQKVPLIRKNDIGILENGNGDIVWIAGFRIDERYKITANTKKVFIFEQYT